MFDDEKNRFFSSSNQRHCTKMSYSTRKIIPVGKNDVIQYFECAFEVWQAVKKSYFSRKFVGTFCIFMIFEVICSSHIHVLYMKFKYISQKSFKDSKSEAARSLTMIEIDCYVAVTNFGCQRRQIEFKRAL